MPRSISSAESPPTLVSDLFLPRLTRSRLLRPMRLFLSLIALALAGCATQGSDNAIHLLQPDNFYPFLRDAGRDKDPDHVFNWENGTLHITGQHYGYIGTKQTNF